MALTHRCCCRDTHGLGVYLVCEFCTAGSAAVGSSIGARFAIELVGDACQRDHGELCRITGGLVALFGGFGDGSW